MITIELGSSGRRTTQLGFGCSGLMASMDRGASLRMLESAIDAGIRHFDVAPMYGYGEAEACLGEYLARHAGLCTVTTKFGIAPPERGGILLGSARRLAAPVVRAFPALKQRLARSAAAVTGGAEKLRFTAEQAQSSLEHSLRALRLEKVDLFLLHEATVADLGNPDLLRFLEDATREGKIGSFGVASTRVAAKELVRERPAFCAAVQTEWSLLDSFAAPRSLHLYHRIFAEAFQSLRSGLQGSPDRCRRWSTATGVDLSDSTELSALLFKMALLLAPQAVVLFSTTNVQHLQANVAVANDDALESAARRLHELVQAEPMPQPLHHHRRVA